MHLLYMLNAQPTLTRVPSRNTSKQVSSWYTDPETFLANSNMKYLEECDYVTTD